MKVIVFFALYFFMLRNLGLQLHIASIGARFDLEHLKYSRQKVVKVAEGLMASPVDVSNCMIFHFDARARPLRPRSLSAWQADLSARLSCPFLGRVRGFQTTLL